MCFERRNQEMDLVDYALAAYLRRMSSTEKDTPEEAHGRCCGPGVDVLRRVDTVRAPDGFYHSARATLSPTAAAKLH
jgi:hypothetical protein